MARSVKGRVTFTMRRVAPLPTCAHLLALTVFASPALADAPVAQAPAEPSESAHAEAGAVEEVTVVGERVQLTDADRRRIYQELVTGNRLFADKKIKEAFPYLLNTAERGFKESQAKVGHIYAYGLGEVERDTSQAVGWLGVAAAGGTSRPIKNYFNTIWKRIPEQHVPYFEEVVEDYKTKYGENATGVVCETYRPTHSYIKRLGCFFKEDMDSHMLDALARYFAERTRFVETQAREEQLRIILQSQQLGQDEDS